MRLFNDLNPWIIGAFVALAVRGAISTPRDFYRGWLVFKWVSRKVSRFIHRRSKGVRRSVEEAIENLGIGAFVGQLPSVQAEDKPKEG